LFIGGRFAFNGIPFVVGGYTFQLDNPAGEYDGGY
jgi:hypothetical protein